MRKLSRLFVVLILAAALFSGGQSFGQGSDLALNGASMYVPIGQGIPWNQINRVYYFAPMSSSIGICVFFVNNNPTSSHTFAVSIFQTGDPATHGYTGHSGRWTADVVVGTASPVAASTTTSVFAQSSAAAQIAISISGATLQAGSPDTADVYIVQTTGGNCGSVGFQIVAGADAVGQALNYNPLVIAGITASGLPGLVRPLACEPFAANGSCGLDLGQPVGLGNGFASVMAMNNGGTLLGVLPFIQVQGSGQTVVGGPFPSTNFPAGIMWVHEPGILGQTTATITANGATQLILGGVLNTGVGSNCGAWVQIQGPVTGTTPTLDLYIQDSGDGGNWNDRVHFPQITAIGTWWASYGVSTGASPVPGPIQTNTLAAATAVPGQVQPRVRVSYVVGGATPSFGNVTTSVVCR